ncbi:MAG TPA: transaldolase family protein, partial [Anaerolineales bacterium]|nr:transaldolase family protein [Anaerolineales bacterium]
IEPLIAPHTINTVPVETLDAYRDHGQPELSLEQEISRAYHVLGDLPFVGIDLDAATQQLEEQGVQNFVSALDRLMAALQEKQAAVQTIAPSKSNA